MFNTSLVPSFFVVLYLLLQCGSHAADVPADPITVADPELNLYWMQDKLCGALAVHIALRDQGISSDFLQTARALPPGQNGSSMQDCARVLSKSGVDAKCIRASESSLLSILRHHPSCGAIVLLDNNHWCYIRIGKDGELKGFENPSWRTAADLKIRERYSNVAIIIGDSSSLYSYHVIWLGAIVVGFVVSVLLLYLSTRYAIRYVLGR